jgi:hypothetical protein
MDTGNGYFQEVSDANQEAVKSIYEELQTIEAKKAIKRRMPKTAIPTLEEAEKQHPNHGGTFYIGQNVEMNGSKFRVLMITKKTITLRLLPA